MVALLAWIASGWLLPESAPVSHGVDVTDKRGMDTPGIEALLSTPLFGRPEAKPARFAPKPVTPSRLNAKLLGTVVAGAHSAAVLQLGGVQHVFFAGDVIRPGFRLSEVRTDAVIIDHGGRLERIGLEKAASLAATAFSSSAPGPVSRPPSRAPRRIARAISRKRLERDIHDFPRLLSQARVAPYFVDGKANGFVISDIVPGSLYDQAGLKNGDVIRRVNGRAVTSAQQAMAMYQDLQKAPAIDLEVLRAGQALQLHYDIR